MAKIVERWLVNGFDGWQTTIILADDGTIDSWTGDAFAKICLGDGWAYGRHPDKALRGPEFKQLQSGELIPLKHEKLGESKDEADNFDAGKLRWELLPIPALEEVTKVFAFGADKYADDNWTRGMKWRRHVGSLLRHVFAFAKGEDIDPESGLHHLAHAGCRVLMLLTCAMKGIGTDDRLKL